MYVVSQSRIPVRRSSRILKRRVTNQLPSSFVRSSTNIDLHMHQLSARSLEQKRQSAEISDIAAAKSRQQYIKQERSVQQRIENKDSVEVVREEDKTLPLLMEGKVNEICVQKEGDSYQTIVESQIEYAGRSKQDGEKVKVKFFSNRYFTETISSQLQFTLNRYQRS